MLVGWLVVWPFLNWLTTHFVITDRRVMFRHGVLTRQGIDIPLARINSVEFRHGLIDRMVRTGTLIIESASQDPLEFHDIPRVEQVHSLLYHEVFDTLGGEESAEPFVRKALIAEAQRGDVRGAERVPNDGWCASCTSSIASAMPPAVRADSSALSGFAAELVGEHPAPERPESERHLQQVADDVGGDEVGDVLRRQRYVGHAEQQHVAGEPQRGHAQQHADAADAEEQQRLVVAFAAAAVAGSSTPG